MDIICDVDGTLMNVVARVEYVDRCIDKNYNKEKWWDKFLDDSVMLKYDTPNEDVVSIINSLHKDGHQIIITSARNERHKKTTIHQLKQAGVNYNNMYLRKDGDMRADEICKRDLFYDMMRNSLYPRVAFDDRDVVVDMWRKMGIFCYQVRRGNF